MTNELLKVSQKYCTHFSESTGANCAILDTVSRMFINGHNFCSQCGVCQLKDDDSHSNQKYINPHLYGCSEAERWGGKYVYYCPIGLVFIATIISDDVDVTTGGFISGPFVMGDLEDFLLDINNLSKHYKSLVKDLPIVSTSKVTHICEILAAISAFISNKSLSDVDPNINQSNFLNSLYSISESIDIEEEYRYPINIERELQAMISTGDKSGSQELLNELLGHIFFRSNGDFELIKARILELIVLLSRASIEGGADVEQIFWLNANYLKEVNNFKNIEELSVWLSGVMNRFTNYAFDFIDVKHTDIIYKVIEYIKRNYTKKLTLENIANHVYLSKSYLSKIFKDEMECNLTAYINKVRVEKSKILLVEKQISLVDIANIVGFEDQSYFTKVFKKLIGVSPGRYRERRGKI